MASARDAWQAAQGGSDYIDVHNWRFSPASFQLVIDDLRELGLLELGIIDGPTGAGGEFCACLQRGVGERKDRMLSLASIERSGR
jgi:hypothetical protein